MKNIIHLGSENFLDNSARKELCGERWVTGIPIVKWSFFLMMKLIAKRGHPGFIPGGSFQQNTGPGGALVLGKD